MAFSPFQRPLRALNGDEVAVRVTLMAVGAIAFCFVAAWATEARFSFVQVTGLGRTKPHGALHRREPPDSRKLLRSNPTRLAHLLSKD